VKVYATVYIADIAKRYVV